MNYGLGWNILVLYEIETITKNMAHTI